MTLEELTTHISHKKKSIADLIRFIGNTPDSDDDTKAKTHNYSILLGSGASVSSGIRSGQTLIDQWKKEVYEEDMRQSKPAFEDYFKPGMSPEWYEEENAYSCLFENRFDLQRHRRMFVEHEVAGKTPSIGYAYLVKLIENGFFNTFFTTNFDDLLNEAFYRFSKNRPIVCAHDSSISGISVTSTRPKIIKLHGDYLFDDIKTTLRETESLEVNMKMKFQEFAKDFGLIVVGYSGQDRSIMDILTYLLQHEDYFKNGIIWCIRKGETNISTELKKLLWRDRVYFVEIEGFDELFAELNFYLNDGKLPIDDAFLSRSHQENIIKELTAKTLANAGESSKRLRDDCLKLRDHLNNNFENEYLNYLRSKKIDHSQKDETRNARRKYPYPSLSGEEKKDINDLITEAFGTSHKKIVLSNLLQRDIMAMSDSGYKLELLELQADLNQDMDDVEIRKIFDELIRLDPVNEKYYDIASNRSVNIKQSLYFLEKAANKFENDSYILNKYADVLLDFYYDQPIVDVNSEQFNKISALLDRSLELYPSADNYAYSNKIRYYKLKYRQLPKDRKKKCHEVSDDLFSLNKYHPQTISLLGKIDSEDYTKEHITEALDYYKKADSPKAVENIYLELINWMIKKESFDSVLPIYKEYEDAYIASDNYKFSKAQQLMDHEYFDDALKLFEDLKETKRVTRRKMTLLHLLNRKEELEKLYSSNTNSKECRRCYLECTNQYELLMDYYKEIEADKGYLSTDELISYAYALLQCEDYEGVIKLLKPSYDNPQLAEGAIVINFLFARKKLGNDVKKQINKKILEHEFIEYSDFEKLGAYCVLEDISNIRKCLSSVLKNDPSHRYVISDWPIMKPFKTDAKIAQLLKPRLYRLDD